MLSLLHTLIDNAHYSQANPNNPRDGAAGINTLYSKLTGDFQRNDPSLMPRGKNTSQCRRHIDILPANSNEAADWLTDSIERVLTPAEYLIGPVCRIVYKTVEYIYHSDLLSENEKPRFINILKESLPKTTWYLIIYYSFSNPKIAHLALHALKLYDAFEVDTVDGIRDFQYHRSILSEFLLKH